MTYHAELSSDGAVPLPEELARALGFRPGDKLSIGRSGQRVVVTRDEGRDAAVARLREAMKGYSVEQFLADRRTDSGE